MKGKLVTMAVSFLLCVGMVGAGFASWVITNTAEEEADATIKVDTVVDKRLKLTLGQNDLDVYFGFPVNPETTNVNPWLISDSTEKEDLECKVSVVLDGENLAKLTAKGGVKINLTATFEIETEDQTAYNDAIKYQLISATTTDVQKTLEVDEATVEAKTVDFEFSFAWGQFFGGLNPYTYFNDTFGNSADTNNLVLPGDAEGNDIILPEGVTVEDGGDLADFVLGLIEKIGTLDVKVTITATLAE
jgi:hypothetical protein